MITILTAALAGVAGALVTLALKGVKGAGKASQTIRAEKFEVVDKAGKVRGVFGASDDSSRLLLYDASWTVRIGLAVLKDGPVLTLSNADGKPRTELNLDGLNKRSD